ncbi:hypothetical protein WR25_18044 [Diploscapter pachys]|uniref:RING-type E3 ubiquitin transferase BRCA1 n=1 Tax=Diploscapter pachys TaxID=2018661 RepID=A0A2A2JDZ0_9BILA|nr:hypothetical protein WR25_18044 [Diploscapter pachys]
MSKQKPIFEYTFEAAENFRKVISCVKCRTPTDQLQHLGTSCKHVFCWDCIRSFDGMNYSEILCPSCLYPVETGAGKIVKSNLFANLSNNIDRFVNLLQEYDDALKKQGGRVELPAQTQRMLEGLAKEADEFENDPENVEIKRKKNVEEFFATQRLAPLPGVHPSTPNAETDCSTSKRTSNKTPGREASCSRKRILNQKEVDTDTSIEEPLTAKENNDSVVVLNSNDDSLSMSPELGESPLILRHLEPLTTTTTTVQVNTPSKFLASNREKSNQTPGNSKHATLRQSARLSPLKRNPSNHSLHGRSAKDGAGDLCQTQKIPSCTPSPELGYDGEEGDRVQNRVPTITLSSDEGSGWSGKKGNDRLSISSTSTSNESDFQKTPIIIRKNAAGKRPFETMLKDIDPQLMIDESPVIKTRRKSQANEPRIFRLISREDINGIQAELVKSSSDLNTFDSQLQTPLYLAVTANNAEIAEMLISHGAMINAVCGEVCNTALHAAISLGLDQIAKLLLSKGADRKIKNAFGKSPENCAEGNRPMVKLLSYYKTYPRQPSILPERPSNYCVALLDAGLLNESEMRRVARYGTIEFCDSNFQGMTHLVVKTDESGFVPMNMSVLRAILKGIPIVQVNWIKECLAKRQFIEEIGRFECDSVANEDGKRGTIREWKRCHLKKTPKLFRGMHFYFHHDKFPSSVIRYEEKYDYNFVCELISLGEGIVMQGTHPPSSSASRAEFSFNRSSASISLTDSRPPPFHNKEIPNDIIIYDVALSSRNMNPRMNVGLGTLTWLIDAILMFCLIRPY